jgi:hypothetical protein
VTAARPEPQADGVHHAAAVARSLGWADEAAERADWADALGWIDVVEACGDALSDEFRAKRDRWRLALSEQSPPSERAERPRDGPTG